MSDLASVADPETAPVRTGAHDVVFAFFSTSWTGAFQRELVMPEDRLAVALTEHPAVGRLLVCDPYRSVAGRMAARLRRRPEAPFRASATRRLQRPLRLRRTDPVEPARAVARYEAGMRRAAAALGLERPAVITAHPLVAGFGRFDWAGPVTYYGWDDWTASRPHEQWWPAYEEAFARLRTTGRRACAISEAALSRIAPSGPGLVLPNGIDPAEWLAIGPPPEWFAARARPRLVYHGSVDSRVDVAMARAVAEAHPEGSLTFVGDVREPAHFAGMQDLPNVEFHPSVDRAELTRIVAAADVGLVPHAHNALTEAMSPLKLYEYLAAGRPVAAVDLPPIRAVEGRVALAPPGGDLRPAVAAALAMGPAPEPERKAFVHEHSWAGRFDRLLEFAVSP
jgi:glycosyltransferase involved in cell wall biosynthesis